MKDIRSKAVAVLLIVTSALLTYNRTERVLAQGMPCWEIIFNIIEVSTATVLFVVAMWMIIPEN